VIGEGARCIGFGTNNEAEYFGLLAGLEEARGLDVDAVDVIMDSELVIKQMRGEYRVKAKNLKPLAEEVRKLVSGFDKVTFSHVGRENPMISRADALLNQELDDQALLKRIRKG